MPFTLLQHPPGTTLALADARYVNVTGDTMTGTLVTASIAVNSGTLTVADNTPVVFGGSSDASIRWSSLQTADAVLIITNVGSNDQSGNIIVTVAANFNKDHDHAFSLFPTLILHGATDPDSDNTLFVSLGHNDTDAILNVGSGDLEISAAQVRAPSGTSTVLARGDGTVWITITSGGSAILSSVTTVLNDNIVLAFGSASDVAVDWSAAQATASNLVMGLRAAGDTTGGGTLILTELANVNKDHDLDVSSVPQLAIFSATDPDSANDEYILIKHNGSAGQIETGSGNLTLTIPGGALRPNVTNALALGTTAVVFNNVFTRNLQGQNGIVLAFTQAVNASGSATGFTFIGGAHTTLDASTEALGLDVDFSATVEFATGALALQRAMLLQAPTYAFVGASVIATAGTLVITDEPQAGTNATITQPAALIVEAGNVAFFSATPTFGGGAEVMFIGNRTTAPTSNPTAGVVVYGEAGAGKARGDSGTVTTWAPADPHCKTCKRDFALEWENDGTTSGVPKGTLAICMWCLMATLEAHQVDVSQAMIHRNAS